MPIILPVEDSKRLSDVEVEETKWREGPGVVEKSIKNR